MKVTQYTQTPDNLFALLSKYRVIIPGIQRHYVQGSDNAKAKEVRENFVKLLLSGKDMQLHFVYGPISYDGEDAFIPVDGQQRLTTLWLLARYAAEKLDDEKQKEDILNLLSRFSYADRVHATRFCKALCSNSWCIENSPEKDIPRQSWFFDYWKEDETVASMLRMLGTIHSEFVNDNVNPQNVLDALVDKIKFSLRIDSFEDDIYMKMNARGLQLTQWENFKARFADKLSKDVKTKWDTEIESLSNKYFEAANYCLPDDAFFALMGRVCYYLSFGGENKNDNLKNLASLASAELSKIPYVPFEEFTEVLKDKSIDDFAIQFLNLIDLILNKAKDKAAYLNSPYWEKRSIIETFFNPTNENERDFSLCFFEYVKSFPNADYNSFSQAYRFIWNILENVSRNEYNRVAYVKAQLECGDSSLYPANEDWLRSKLAETNNNTPEQLKEEWQKALQMHAANQDKPMNWVGDWQNWQDAIKQAESYAFFKGAIRFLFQNEIGTVDWSQFDTKFENAKKYFDENGVQGEYKKDAILLRFLIKYFDKWELMKEIYFNNEKDNWRTWILLNEKLQKTVHELLMYDVTNFKDILSNYTSQNTDATQKRCRELLIKTDFLHFLAKKDTNDFVLYEWEKHKYLKIERGRGSRTPDLVFCISYTNAIGELFAKENHDHYTDKQVKGYNVFTHWNLPFKYDGNYFVLYSNDTICLMNKDWNGKRLRNNSEADTPENNYSFPNDKMPVDMSSADDIIKAMKDLIKEANSISDSENQK